MIYPHLKELNRLVEEKLVGKHQYPTMPLIIYNYTAKAVTVPQRDWSPALSDARGLVLDDGGRIVAKPFSKFWNYEQVLDKIPTDEPFQVWEKLDGSLGIVFNFCGNRIVATRGSFESEQAKWATEWLDRVAPEFLPEEGQTFLFEIIYANNRIVVDYGGRAEMVLLAVIKNSTGKFLDDVFEFTTIFPKARRFDGMGDHAELQSYCSQFPGEEGFVVRWQGGFMAKVKFEEYKRLHRLITQCSTRTIWELLRDGKDGGIDEIMTNVPADFQEWASGKITELNQGFSRVLVAAKEEYASVNGLEMPRKEFAEWAKKTKHPHLMFALLDGRSIHPMIWKMVEPAWATPFRCGGDL